MNQGKERKFFVQKKKVEAFEGLQHNVVIRSTKGNQCRNNHHYDTWIETACKAPKCYNIYSRSKNYLVVCSLKIEKSV